MRAAALLPLLLLGTLQAAIAPATSPLGRDGHLQFRDNPLESPLTPAEGAKTFKRLAEAPQRSALRVDWKLQMGVLAGAPRGAGDGDPGSSRIGVAGQTGAASIQLRPRLPRAPPPAPPL